MQRLGSAVAVRTGQVLAIAGTALFALWVVAPRAAVALGADGVPTPATALALLLVGLVIGWPGLSRRAELGLLATAAAVAVEGVLAAALDLPLFSAYRLFPASWQAATPDGSGRMAVPSALCVLLLTGALGLGVSRRRGTTLLGVSAFGLAYVSTLGHLYGVSELVTLQTATSMAVPTTLAVLAAAAAVVLRDESLPVPRALRAPGTAGALVRALVGWTLLLPPAEAWLVVGAIRRGWVDAAFGLSVVALLSAVGGLMLVLIGARTAARTDRAREAAVAELETLNAVLSERVAAGVAEAEEGHERLAFLLDSTPVGIFETGPDGVRRYVNQRWRELTGISAAETTGSDWASVLHPDDRERVVGDWAAAVAAGSDYTGRYRYLRPDGTVTWVQVRALAVRGADGQVTRWLGSVTDVTDQVEAADRLSASELLHRSVVATMAEGVVLLNRTGRIVTVNDAACRLLGHDADDLVGVESADARWGALRDDGTELPDEDHPPMLALRTGRAVRDMTVGVLRPDGSRVWLSVSSELLIGADGAEVEGVVTTFADVTAARADAAALRRSEEQFRHAMAHAPIGMALVELDGRFREVNRALAGLVGYDASELMGLTFQQITHPEDIEADLTYLARLLDGSLDHYTMEKRYVTKSGEIVWVLLAVSLARDDQDRPAYFISQIQDVTDTRAAQERLAHRALHDPLTGLPNRDLLMDHLSNTLARSARSGTSTAVMFCDLDHFKAVNDTYGHEAGDLFLIGAADQLRAVMRPGDTVARLGGDEFVVVAEGLRDRAAVLAVAERVRRALDEPMQLAGHVVRTGVSIGVAIATSQDDARSVLREADAAMYRAKALGRGRLELSVADGDWGAPQQVPGPRGAVAEELEQRPA